MQTAIFIDKQFCGPPNSANGGYAAGLIAKNVPFSAEITLRNPPPLNQPLQLIATETTATLRDQATLVAEAKAADFQLDLLPPVAKSVIQQSTNLVEAQQAEVFKDCFVCGKGRQTGDGLQIYPCDVGPQQVACIWKPTNNLGDLTGHVQTEYIWAALDCPGIWAVQDATQVYLLGRINAKEVKPILVGREYTVMGWVIEMEGRKLKAGTAIYETATDTICAYAKSTWIKLK